MQTFGTTQAVREYLLGLGFPAIRKGMTNGVVVAKDGRKARIAMGLLSKTGQSSTGAAVWGFIVTVGA